MTQIWYEDITNFIKYDNYYQIFPLKEMTLEEKLNALLRLFIYVGIILALIKLDYRYIFIGIITGLISVIVYNFEISKKTESEKFLTEKELDILDNKLCTRSTVDNPFMNPSVADIAYNPSHPGACDVLNPKTQKKMEDNFNAKLFRDVSDIYGKMSSQREFYTVPSTTIPNDQTGFAKWLFGDSLNTPSCKEGNGFECYNNRYREYKQ